MQEVQNENRQQHHILSQVNIQPWMHLPLQKKILPRVLFNSYCPVGSGVFTGKRKYNSCSSTALLWFDTCLPAHMSLFTGVCHSSKEVLQMFSMLLRAMLACVSSTQKEDPSRQWNKCRFQVAFYSIQWLKCYKCAWVHISHLTNEVVT